MTERIYYTDPTVLEFEAAIEACDQGDAGNRVVLDRTAFYPTSGGQLHDTGTLGPARVTDVVEDDDGRIVHLTDTAPGKVGDTITGRVDAPRRRQNRQLHTAQHIISAVFVDMGGHETVSVHLGLDYGAVELDTDNLEPAFLHSVESRANDLIADSLPVDIQFVDEDKAKELPLRKTPTKQGTIRVIKTGELDYSACGGTHCRSTAEVRLVKFIGIEKMRGHVLVKFLAGEMAVTDYFERYAVTDTLARSLTCHVTDLPGVVARQRDEGRSLRKLASSLERELLPMWAGELAAGAERVAGWPVVAATVDRVDASNLGPLATLAAQHISGIAILHRDGRIVIATASQVRVNAAGVVATLRERTGLKGGGNQDLAQIGGGEAARFPDYLEQIKEILADV